MIELEWHHLANVNRFYRMCLLKIVPVISPSRKRSRLYGPPTRSISVQPGFILVCRPSAAFLSGIFHRNSDL